jgi:protein ImuA
MTQSPDDRAALLSALRGVLARHQAAPRAGVIGVARGIDESLPGGGLARGAVHEILAAEPGTCTAFCGHLLGRAGGPAAWIAPPRAADLPWPPGLAALGLAPADLILLDAAGDDALWAAEQALRSPALGAVVALLPRLDLASARRLQLAAEAGGTLGLLLRPEQARPHGTGQAPTAARTRWRISPLPGAGAAPYRLGAARWRLSLLLARGGRPGAWDVTLDSSRNIVILDEAFGVATHG